MEIAINPSKLLSGKNRTFIQFQLMKSKNILCDPVIIETAIKTFISGDMANQNYLDLFWKEFEANKVQQTVWYVNNIINNKF